MSEERMAILEMLQEGKISAQEAAELIKRVPENGQRPNYQQEGRRQNSEPLLNPDFVDNIRDSIVDVASNISDIVANQDFSFFDFGRPAETMRFESNRFLQDINTVKLMGKNDKIVVLAYDGDTIQVEASYRMKRNAAPIIDFSQDNESLIMNYDVHSVHSMGLKVMIPSKKIDRVFIDTTNAPILINGMRFNEAKISTTNGPLDLKGLKGGDLFAETKNASVILGYGALGKVEISTGNGKIDLNEVTAQGLGLKTSNAAIKLIFCNAGTISAISSNGKISMEELQYPGENNGGTMDIDVKTSNGNIAVDFGKGNPSAVSIAASTTFGKINHDFGELITSQSDSNYLNGRTTDYDQASEKADVRLRTTNGNIRIRRG